MGIIAALYEQGRCKSQQEIPTQETTMESPLFKKRTVGALGPTSLSLDA